MIIDPNIATVELAAEALGPLRDELVLVGGCTVGLLLTDTTRSMVRATTDVDLITEVTPRVNYYALCDRLRALGFREQPTEEVICRWARGELLIDVMPTDGDILQFTNSWYKAAARHAVWHQLPSGKVIRRVTAPLFLATKLEAFRSRGQGDYLHHDIEDVVTIVDGRESVVDEVLKAPTDVREFIQDEFDALLADPKFIDRLAWLLPRDTTEAQRNRVINRLGQLSGM